MRLVLNLGVIDIPYSQSLALSAAQRRTMNWRSGKKPWQPSSLTHQTTTGAVAEILENRYGVMETFYTTHQSEVHKALEIAMAGHLENALMGAPASGGIVDIDLSEIEARFRHFLDAREMDGLVAGVPTKASLAGINHRLKHPNAKTNPVRPSFIDTGLYQASMRAWLEEK